MPPRLRLGVAAARLPALTRLSCVIDIGRRSPAFPVTPPCVRVAYTAVRLVEDSHWASVMRPAATKYDLVSATSKALEWLMGQHPFELPAVALARRRLTPSLISSAQRRFRVFHCFHRYARRRRRIH